MKHITHNIILLSLLLLSPCAQAITILSNGAEMSDSLLSAIRTHDTIVLDGSAGEFVIGHTIVLMYLDRKTIIGTHGACLRTRFRLTEDIHAMLDSAGVMPEISYFYGIVIFM